MRKNSRPYKRLGENKSIVSCFLDLSSFKALRIYIGSRQINTWVKASIAALIVQKTLWKTKAEVRACYKRTGGILTMSIHCPFRKSQGYGNWHCRATTITLVKIHIPTQMMLLYISRRLALSSLVRQIKKQRVESLVVKIARIYMILPTYWACELSVSVDVWNRGGYPTM